MTLGWIVKRLRQEWRVLILLLLAVSMVVGFFALGPLYLNSVNEVDLRYALDHAEPEQKRITIITSQPITAEGQALIEESLGELVTDVARYKRSSYTAPQAGTGGGNQGTAGTAVCWATYNLGEPVVTANSSFANDPCLQLFAFDDLSERVEVVEGRLPVRGPTPEQVGVTLRTRNGVHVEQQAPIIDQFRYEVGMYSRGEIEAVVSDIVAEKGQVDVGSRFVIGGVDPAVGFLFTMVKIVGIVHVKDPNDPLWAQGNRMFFTDTEVPIDQTGRTRYDWGLAFHPDAYEDWISPILTNTSLRVNTQYVWLIETDTDTITSDNANELTQNLNLLENELRDRYGADAQVTTRLDEIVAGYDKRVQDAQGAIVFLSGAVLVLLLYHLLTTVSLVLQQQGKEWSMISSRGGSTMQLLKLQAFTVVTLGVLGMGIGLGLTYLFMQLMQTIGPLAEALDGARLPRVVMPAESLYLGIGAAVLSVTVLTLPAIPAARTSLLRLKQAVSRPPTRPFWAQYFIDVILIVLSLLLFLRLYDNLGGDTSALVNDLFAAPNRVIEQVANNIPEEGGLNDPFNLAAPAMFLTGIAMLWLRFFPVMMRFISRFTSNRSSLTGPLAVWNVERDPGHYAQLVLLLIGTLALGTASIGLQATRDRGAWNIAQEETGGAVRVDLDPTQVNYANTPAWERLDGVNGYADIVRGIAVPDGINSSRDIHLIGLDAHQFSQAFPEFASQVEGLEGQPDLAINGLPLPLQARQLSVQVYSEAIATAETDDVSVMLMVYLLDSHGILYEMSMRQPNNPGSLEGNIPLPTPPNMWVTLSGDLPTTGLLPYYVYRVEFVSEQYTRPSEPLPPLDALNLPSQTRSISQIESLTHTVYLDLWQTIDDNGVASRWENYETRPTTWATTTDKGPYPLAQSETLDNTRPAFFQLLEFAYVNSAEANLPQVGSDEYTVLKAIYQQSEQLRPSIGVNLNLINPVPVILSEEYAKNEEGFRETFDIGDVRTRQLPLYLSGERNVSDYGLGTISFNFEIRGIIDEFPTLLKAENTSLGPVFIIMPIEYARLLMNQVGNSARFFDVSQVWLNLEEREPTDELRQDLESTQGVSTVTYAWTRHSEILREPLPSAIAGMLFVGFWVSLGLSLLDFAFYIVVTAQQRAFTFGVLRSLGWDSNHIWRLLLYEQITLVVPALLIGSILGTGLAYLILPFLTLLGGATLLIPVLELLQLMGILILSFVMLLVVTAVWLRQMSVNQVLRLGEE